MARVSNQFLVKSILTADSGNKKVYLTPIYNGDPDFDTGVSLASNAERSIEILVPKNSITYNFFSLGAKYYMDFTAV